MSITIMIYYDGMSSPLSSYSNLTANELRSSEDNNSLFRTEKHTVFNLILRWA